MVIYVVDAEISRIPLKPVQDLSIRNLHSVEILLVEEGEAVFDGLLEVAFDDFFLDGH